jgi:hypothetical protein
VNEKWVERVRILPIVGPNLVRVQVCHEGQDRPQWWGENSRHVTARGTQRSRETCTVHNQRFQVGHAWSPACAARKDRQAVAKAKSVRL